MYVYYSLSLMHAHTEQSQHIYSKMPETNNGPTVLPQSLLAWEEK